jgi:hypothetical protein
MKYLKKFNENNINLNQLKILRYGFEILMNNTHLIENQIKNNLDNFLNEFNIIKFNFKFGKIIKFLGAGVFGAVYKLDNKKIIKITFDFHEAPFLYQYCNGNIKGLVKIDKIFKIKFGNSNAYIIIRDPITLINNKIKYKNEIEIAKNAMYNISPEWRGTHSENFGLQNGKVVLYDGFCKKTPVDEKKIPFLEL